MSNQTDRAEGTSVEADRFEGRYDFRKTTEEAGLELSPITVDTLQVNVTRLCNQACLHCHVDASPRRTEQMDRRTIDRCLEILSENGEIEKLDVTGGAPELNPHFDYFVTEARKLGKHVMVRHNLTVTLDGNPQTGESKEYLPDFFAENSLEVVSSLPYFQSFFTDRQRGRGVFDKSVESMGRLNRAGYGSEETGLLLNLVYNPIGAFLPPCQQTLELDYRKELSDKFGLIFNSLFTITNMPIHRFRTQLERNGGLEEYMDRLVNAFNPEAAGGVMCRSIVSVGHDGTLYDCDFNQMLDMPIGNGKDLTVFDFDFNDAVKRRIRFAPHCFGCAAGAGSSCGGETA